MTDSKICVKCGKEFQVDTRQSKAQREKQRFCGHRCAGYELAVNPNWKGAITAALKRRWADPKYKAKRREEFSGPKNPRYVPNGTKHISTTGRKVYWRIKTERGWEWEHRVIAREMLGRELLRIEHVHHVNNNGLDNSPENLQVLDQRTHHQVTWAERTKPCPNCGKLHWCK